MKLEPVKVAEIRPMTRNEALIRLGDVPEPWYEAYRDAGMKVRVRAKGSDGKTVEAVLGLASRPRRRPLEMLVEATSDVVAALRGGASLEVSAPHGTPVPLFDFRGHDVVLVGRGAGMGVVRGAVLAAMVECGAFKSVRVLAEASYTDEIPFRDELPAWQRAGVTVHQVLSRPDAGKWKAGEACYVHEMIESQGIADPARTVAVVAGPDDMIQGVTSVLRRLEVPPDRTFVFEHASALKQHRAEAARPADLLAKVSVEGVWGSGHENDAPDHPPVVSTPAGQPRAHGVPRYKRPSSGGGGH